MLINAIYVDVIINHDLPQTFTAGDDYSPVNEMFIFGPGRDSVQCLNVTVNDNDVFEASESFMLSLTVEHESAPVNTAIHILDDECKTLNYHR